MTKKIKIKAIETLSLPDGRLIKPNDIVVIERDEATIKTCVDDGLYTVIEEITKAPETGNKDK